MVKAVAPGTLVARKWTAEPAVALMLFAQVPQLVWSRATKAPPLILASTPTTGWLLLTEVSTHQAFLFAEGVKVAVKLGGGPVVVDVVAVVVVDVVVVAVVAVVGPGGVVGVVFVPGGGPLLGVPSRP